MKTLEREKLNRAAGTYKDMRTGPHHVFRIEKGKIQNFSHPKSWASTQPFCLVLKLEKNALAAKKKYNILLTQSKILKLIGIKSKITNQKCMNKHLILDKERDKKIVI